MIQVHFADNLSGHVDSWRKLYDGAALLGMWPAPLFTMLTGVSLSLVLDDGPVCEAARHDIAVALVGVEIGGDRFGKIQVGHRSLRGSCGDGTMTLPDKLENHL